MRVTRRQFHSGLAATTLLVAGAAQAAEFQAATHTDRDGRVMPYRLFQPDAGGRKLPIVLWLHGSGGRGSDNLKQIGGGNTSGATLWTRPAVIERQPSIVVAPQCPEGGSWTTLDDRVDPTPHLHHAVEILQLVLSSQAADPARVYAVGQSMGGFAAWSLPVALPGLFAAIAPVCGGGDVRRAASLSRVPVWAFHGALDEAVPVQRSREMIAALRKAGGGPRYTEYPDVAHPAWEPAFRDPGLPTWLFAQRRPTG